MKLFGLTFLLILSVSSVNAQSQPWDKAITNDRFKVLSDFNDAVLDKETGLVWDQSPLTGHITQLNALINCAARTVGSVFRLYKSWRV